MANYFTEFAEALAGLTVAEAAWLKEQLTDCEPELGTPLFLAQALPEEDWADHLEIGFTTTFEDNALWIRSDEGGDVNHAVILIQAFLKKFRPQEYRVITYCEWCDSPKVGAFGGGAYFITADKVEWSDAHQFIAQKLAEFNAQKVT